MDKERFVFKHILKSKKDDEKDKLLWQRIQAELNDETEAPIAMTKSKPKLSWAKIASACASVLAVAAVGIIVGVSINGGDEVGRYCTQNDYYYARTDKYTLKSYSEENNKGWLYFDWYNPELLESYQYFLKENSELICFNEFVVDPDTGYVFEINVTDDRTRIDILEILVSMCPISTSIDNVKVMYGTSHNANYAYFTYEKNIYYVSADTQDKDYFLEKIEQLIPNE